MSRVIRKPVLAGGALSLTSTGISNTTHQEVSLTALAGTTDITIPAGTTAISMVCQNTSKPLRLGIAGTSSTAYLWNIGGDLTAPSKAEWLYISSLVSDGAFPKLHLDASVGVAGNVQVVNITFFH